MVASLFVAVFAMFVLACNGPLPTVEKNQIPVAGDFYLLEYSPIYDGQPKLVSVVARPGKSSGEINISKYKDEESGEISLTPPKDHGVYKVIFDVKPATGWDPEWGLELGFDIRRDTPNEGHLNIQTTFPAMYALTDSNRTVSIEPGNDNLKIKNIEYVNKDGDGFTDLNELPLGDYTVVVNVEKNDYFEEGAVEVGKITINTGNPNNTSFFNIELPTDPVFDSKEKSATITSKYANGEATIKITYKGTDGTKIESPAAPVNADTYTVTFVADAWGDYSTSGTLSAGEFTIEKATPSLDDLDITLDNAPFSGNKVFTYDGKAKEVKATVKTTSAYNEEEDAQVFVRYGMNGDHPTPQNANDSALLVSVTIRGTDNYETKSFLSAGSIKINKAALEKADFDIGGVGEYDEGDDFAVTITPITAKQGLYNLYVAEVGKITTFYEGPSPSTAKTETPPTAPGTYKVTFEGAGNGNFEVVDIEAGELVIKSTAPIYINKDDAKLKSFTVGTKTNGSRTITTSTPTPGQIPSTEPTDGRNNPSSNNTPQSSTITISLTSTEYNKGEGLTVKAEPNDPGARIVGFAMGSSTNITATSWKNGISQTTSQEGIYNEAGIPNGEHTFTVNHTGSSRIFVWVKSWDNTKEGIYRIQTVDDSYTLNAVNTLGSLTVNGVALTPVPPVSSTIPSSATTLYMTTSQYNGGNLVINATKTNALAKVVGYTMTSGTVSDTDTTTWSKYDATNGISGDYVLGAHESGKDIYVWVKAESGANGFYRINVTSVDTPPRPAVSMTDASLFSLKINGVEKTAFGRNLPYATIPGGQGADYYATITMTKAEFEKYPKDENGNTVLKIEAIANDGNALVVGYAVTGSSGDIGTSSNNTVVADSTKWKSPIGTYDEAGISSYEWKGTFTNASDGGTRIFVWVKAGNKTTNGFYRVNEITING